MGVFPRYHENGTFTLWIKEGDEERAFTNEESEELGLEKDVLYTSLGQVAVLKNHNDIAYDNPMKEYCERM